MTKSLAPQLDEPRQDEGQTAGVVSVRESGVVVREQLVQRTCAWCGIPVHYKGKGRPPQYCSAAHRTRAWELRTAEARAARPVSDGGRTREPVREVVERTETVVRTVVREGPAKVRVIPGVRLSGAPYTLPEDAVEWVQALMYLRRHTNSPKIHFFREHIARACETTARVLRDPASAIPAPDRQTVASPSRTL
ncbi:hypothetical protein AB0M58_13920 [Streptomyces bobili]|uniref:hypothetical protein n=1 Tax=Streptomyces bobili TaxID=67280 RepID=UPI0034266E42